MGERPPDLKRCDNMARCDESPSTDYGRNFENGGLVMASRWDSVTVDKSPMRCYVAPPEGEGPFPAVVVIQHAGGVDEFVQTMTDRVAAAGLQVREKFQYHGGREVLDKELINGASTPLGHKLQQELQCIPIRCRRMRADAPLYGEITKKYLEPDVRHEWFVKGMSKEQLDKIKKYYEERYGKENAPK